jgi:DNA helicase HerA-like ATPase
LKLKIGTGLALPLEAATETAAILGRRGSGKTHTAVVMAEEMLAAGVQVVILDPLDVWWGLRVAKDGKSAGVAIYVCGGSHADIPLSADAGRILADAVVDRHLSMVLSVRHLSKTDQRRFVGDFCERLYERKADPKHRTALHVFLDEADAFVPQRLVPGSERCFGAVDTMVRRGRSSGLAVTLISQRPQVVNKDVLSQTEVLVAHQLTGPQDRKALQAWIDANDTDGRSDEFMASLASLPRGTAWFWSPGLLKIFARVAVRDRQTFDSSATPKAGVAAVASPKAFARVDLEKLTAEIAATIEKVKADDPRELRKQIAELKAEKGG